MNSDRVDPKVYFGVFLISLASLSLEVLQMRIFAFSLWHHLAFLVVSIAILGFGAAGAFLSVFGWLRDAHLGRSMAVAGLLFMATSFVGPLMLVDETVDWFGGFGTEQLLRTALYYALFALPYFFAGWLVALTMTQRAESVAKLYFANMLGSGMGCFALFLLLVPLGAPATLVVIASLGALVAVFAPCGFLLRGAGVLGFVGCLSILPGINEHVRPIVDPLIAKLPKLDGKDPKQYPHRLKSADEIFAFHAAESKLINTALRAGKKTLATRWSPLGRIDIVSYSATRNILFQDGDAPGEMPYASHEYPPGQLHELSYVVKKHPNALIIGIGGGLDIHMALAKKAKSITAVEINPESFDLYTNQFADVVGRPAKLPNVELRNAEGRHFVRSSDRKFDLIQMSGVDTYTALANGAYVLSESYLYTEEAFHDYFNHLENDGLLSIIRFAFPAPRETLRILVIACKVLADRGVDDPWNHVALIVNSSESKKGDRDKTHLGGILIKKSPFTDAEKDAVASWSDAHGFATKYLPGRRAVAPFDAWEASLKKRDLESFLAAYLYNVRPVRDDNPFFFNQHYWSSVWKWLRHGKKQAPPAGSPWAALTEDFQYEPTGLLLLGLTLAQLAVLVALCIFVPLLFLRSGLVGTSAKAPLGYFLCLGLAYIFLMISAMQRFGLILGHPSYSVTVTMATFLIGSGLGSLASGRIALRHATKLLFFVALVLIGGAYALQRWLPDVSAWLLREPFWMRVLVSVGMLLPLAFVMGMCFPTGVRVLSEGRRALIPWAYGVNGAASVLGSVVTVCIAMSFGFTNVQWVSAGLYVLAAVLMWRMVKTRPIGSPSQASE